MPKLYVIGDLHLSLDENNNLKKPMDIFGPSWQNYLEKLKTNWNKKIQKNDIVIIPGDISWAMNLNEIYYDLKFINNLNGTKYLYKGNHDYYWQTLSKLDNFVKDNNFESVKFVYNNPIILNKIVIIGSRFWIFENDMQNKKILNREIVRLKLMIDKAKEIISNNNEQINDYEFIAFTHYMPITQEQIRNNNLNEAVKLFISNDIKKVYYRHLHSDGILNKVEGNHYGIDFNLVSSDYLDFDPKFIKNL